MLLLRKLLVGVGQPTSPIIRPCPAVGQQGLFRMTSARFPRAAPPQVYSEDDAGARGIDVDEIQAHLPEEPNSFIGRERELGELSQLLSRTRALTLCGPGGIGKTRLALRLRSEERRVGKECRL